MPRRTENGRGRSYSKGGSSRGVRGGSGGTDVDAILRQAEADRQRSQRSTSVSSFGRPYGYSGFYDDYVFGSSSRSGSTELRSETPVPPSRPTLPPSNRFKSARERKAARDAAKAKSGQKARSRGNKKPAKG